MNEGAIVREVRARLADGWVKGTWRAPAQVSTSYCLVGAFLTVSLERGGWPWVAWIRVKELVAERGYDHPGDFNDAAETTLVDVLGVLDRVSFELRSSPN